MKRIALVALVSIAVLEGCATASADRQSYSVVPQVQVVERSTRKKTAQANYQARPEENPLTGSGGSAK